MTNIVLEGKRGIVVASQARVVEEGRELAWAEPFVRRAPDVKWLIGNYVQASTETASRPNSNGHIFPLADLRDAVQDIPNRPLNYLHIPNRRIGCFTAAEFVWPMGEPSAEAAGVEEPPIIEVLAAFWSYYDEGLWPSIEMAHRDGRLWFSMEAVPESLTCMAESCGKSFTYDGPGSLTYCAHLQRPRSQKTLHKPRFTGGALIVPPVRPGWVNANIKEVTQLLEQDLQLTDRLYKEVAAESPQLETTEIENIVTILLHAGG